MRLRDGAWLLRLHAVLAAGLLAVRDAGGVERPAHDLVAHARQVLDAATTHEHDGVLLQVVALARDVGRDLHRARDPHTGDLAERRVRLLRRGRVHAGAHAAALGRGDLLLAPLAGLEARRGELLRLGVAPLADELAGGRHAAGDASKGKAGLRLPSGGRDGLKRVLRRGVLEPLVAGDRLVRELAGRD